MKLYFINLDSRKDRNDFFVNQFDSTNLNPIRIAATSSNETFSDIAPPEVSACWKSHQKAYDSLILSTDSHALIFEDDAVVNKDLVRIIENLQTTDLNGIDLFQLGYLKNPNSFTVDSGKIDFLYRWKVVLSRRGIKEVSHCNVLNRKRRIGLNNPVQSWQINDNIKKKMGIKEPFIYNSFEAGAHCYIISRRLAQMLLEFNTNPVVISADLLLIEIANSNMFNCLRVSKSLSSQAAKLGSNINLRSQLRDNNVPDGAK